MNGYSQRNHATSWLGLLLLLSCSAALAHIDLVPQQTIPSRWETFLMNVPTETESPTVEVHLAIPEGFEVEAIGHRADWNMAVQRDAHGLIREIVWSGGRIPSLTFDEFKFIAKAAQLPGSYEWQARQRYADAQESTWTLRTIVQADGNGPPTQKTEEALKTAQVAMTISFLAIGVATVLIIVTLVTVWHGFRGRGPSDQ
jgi:uncharacterized protein YcnI